MAAVSTQTQPGILQFRQGWQNVTAIFWGNTPFDREIARVTRTHFEEALALGVHRERRFTNGADLREKAGYCGRHGEREKSEFFKSIADLLTDGQGAAEHRKTRWF